MPVTKVNQEKDLGKTLKAPSPSRGTWFSVGVVGAVILITYIVVFGLYMARL